MATELAKAYVQIVPSAQGIQGSISGVLNGEAESAGKQSGETFAKGLGSVAKKAVAAIGIGKIIGDGIASTGEFESAMAKTSTLFSGTGEEFDALRGKILELSGAYGMSATMLAEAAYSAESASVPMDQLGAMLESSAKLATAGFTDVDTALSATAKTMNAYGMNGEDAMNSIQKVLIQTQNLGITTVGELGASLANVTPTAAAMGVSFEQVGAAMAQMTAQGVPTAQATTQLRAAMTELGKSGTKASIAFSEATKGTKYAGKSFQEAIASGATLGEVFSLMQAHADASGLSMVDLWSSVEAGNAALMIASDVETFNRDLAQMGTDADVLGEGYGKMSDTFGSSMNRLKESANNFLITLFSGGDIGASFDTMLKNLGDVGGKLGGWLETGLKNLGQNLPGIMKSLLDFGESILAALGEVNWIELGTTIITGIVGAMGELGSRLLETIKGAVASVTGGDIDFAAIGQTALDGITGVLTALGPDIQGFFTDAVTLLTGEGGILSSFGSVGQSILDAVSGVLNGTDGNFLSSIFTQAETDINGIDWNALGDNVAKAGAAMVNLTGKALAGGFTAAQNIISAIDWAGLGQTVGTVANGLVKLTGKTLSAGFTAAESLIKTIDWEGLGTTVGSAANGLTRLSGDTLSVAFTTAHSLIETIDWAGLGETVGTVANKLIEYSGEALAAPFDAAFGILKGIKWEEVGAAMQSGIGDVWSGLTGFLGGVLGGAGEAAAGIGSGIGSAAEGIGEAIARLFGGDDAKQATEDLKQAMRDLETALKEGAESVKTAAKSVGTDIKDSIQSGMGTDVMKAVGNGALVDILTGMGEGKDPLYAGIAALANAGADKFKGIGWSGVGSAIVTGIISGIQAASGLLDAQMRRLATGALASARSALGINSPSRVMRDEVGLSIPEGIALGISENSGLVDDAMNRMAADMAADGIYGTLAAQGTGFGEMAGTGFQEAADGGFISRITEAIRAGVEGADIALFMDRQKVGASIDEYLGDEMAARRLV